MRSNPPTVARGCLRLSPLRSGSSPPAFLRRVLQPLVLILALPAAADNPPLTQSEMQQVLRTLQTQFANPDATGFTALNRAAIEGLVRVNPLTMQLLTVPDAAPAAPPPLLSVSLTPRVACIRPSAFRKEDTAPLRESLTKLAAGETTALILDLRAPAADTDPAIAVGLAGLFLPKDAPLFSFPGTADLQSASPLKSTTDPVWTRELLILADADTANTAEILAAVLRAGKRALLIGGTTRGRTAAVAELPLRKVETGQLILRYATRRVTFPEMPDPFGKGLMPDISAPQDAATKQSVFALQVRESLARGVFHPARPRTSEASLLARTNPELPARVARTAGKVTEFDTGPTDRPLQLAVDILVANQALSGP